MCLKNTADGEGFGYALVAALHGVCVLCIERAALLVDHDAVIAQSFVTVAVKLLGKESCRMTKRVDGIINNQIIGINLGAQKAQAISIKNRHPSIVQTNGVIGEKVTAHVDKNVVRFHYIDFFNLRIAGQLTGYTAVPTADNQHLFYMGMHGHGHMDNHLVINKLVLLGENDGAITGNKAAKLLRVEHINTLKIRILSKKLLFNFYI